MTMHYVDNMYSISCVVCNKEVGVDESATTCYSHYHDAQRGLVEGHVACRSIADTASSLASAVGADTSEIHKTSLAPAAPAELIVPADLKDELVHIARKLDAVVRRLHDN